MILDIYTHILPDRFFREMSRVSPKLENIGARLRGVKKLFERMVVIRPEVQRVIDKLATLPVDIAPRFVTAEELTGK